MSPRRRRFLPHGCGSKLNHQAGFGPCVHVPAFHSGYLFLTHNQFSKQMKVSPTWVWVKNWYPYRSKWKRTEICGLMLTRTQIGGGGEVCFFFLQPAKSGFGLCGFLLKPYKRGSLKRRDASNGGALKCVVSFCLPRRFTQRPPET